MRRAECLLLPAADVAAASGRWQAVGVVGMASPVPPAAMPPRRAPEVRARYSTPLVGERLTARRSRAPGDGDGRGGGAAAESERQRAV